MSELQKTLLFALALLGAVCVIVGAVLRHHIGGFIETVAREAREEREREEREAQAERAETGPQNDTGEQKP